MKKLFMLLLVLSVTACGTNYPSIEKLLINENAFPSNWVVDSEGPKADSAAPFSRITSYERTMLSFESSTASATEGLERFKNSQEASREFTAAKVVSFREKPEMGPYKIPDELAYKSSFADQFYFACVQPPYYPFPFLGCTYLAQYGPYIVVFDIGWNQDTMSADELEKILNSIDENMKPYSK